MQLTLSEDHYAYVASGKGADFSARVARSGRDVKVRPVVSAMLLAASAAALVFFRF